MSLYQFACAVEGWNRAQGGDAKPEAPSDDETDRMIAATDGI